MTTEQLDNLDKDLLVIMEKYGLKNCSFCGQDSEENFVGLHPGKITIDSLWQSALNVGRQFQHMRENVRMALNRFEKEWK